MVPAIDFYIKSNNSTLLGNLSALIPDDRDSRALNREYRLQVNTRGEPLPDGTSDGVACLNGSIKFKSLVDVEIVLSNMKSLILANESKVSPGSWLGIHYCNQVEDGKPVEPCPMEIFWSN